MLIAKPPSAAPVVYISTYPPRRCGIATYTAHLAAAVSATGTLGPGLVVALEADGHRHAYPQPVIEVLPSHDLPAYLRVADRINRLGAALVSLQHEYGIFGGEAGEYVLSLLRRLHMPVVATLHTVLARPDPPYRRVMEEIAAQAVELVVISRAARDILQQVYGVNPRRITVIPHGAPQPDPQRRRAVRRQLGLQGKIVLCTFGLLSRGKGIEYVLEALPEVVASFPQVVYLVVGQTHPVVRSKEGESYRHELMAMVERLHLEGHVQFVDRYLSESELIDYLLATDIYITPYPGDQQVSSGTLAYAVGMGKVVVSTPYPYARELLGDGTGVLVPYRDSRAIARALGALAASPEVRRELARRAALRGAGMGWHQVGKAYARLFTRVIADAGTSSVAAARPVSPA